MKYIVFDLEATCWKNNNSNGDKEKKKNEIIEIGAIKFNEDLELESEFSIFIKPKVNPILSNFCKELTSITQIQVDSGVSFPEALSDFRAWIDTDDFCLCSWGFYDKKQLIKDCDLHGISSKITENHISIKHQYSKIKDSRRFFGMSDALKMENIPLDGTHHRALDDARNIAKIFIKTFDGYIFP